MKLHHYVLLFVLIYFCRAILAAGPTSRSSTGNGTPKMSASIINLSCAERLGGSSGGNFSYAPKQGRAGKQDLTPYQKKLARGVLARAKSLGAGSYLDKVRIEAYAGGRPHGSRCASYTSSGNSIELAVNCGGAEDNPIRHLAHELGHISGLNGFYESYKSKTAVCHITQYCTQNHNGDPRREEFAEAFATFMFAPDRLKRECRAAYNFMDNYVFVNGPKPEEGCSSLSGIGSQSSQCSGNNTSLACQTEQLGQTADSAQTGPPPGAGGGGGGGPGAANEDPNKPKRKCNPDEYPESDDCEQAVPFGEGTTDDAQRETPQPKRAVTPFGD